MNWRQPRSENPNDWSDHDLLVQVATQFSALFDEVHHLAGHVAIQNGRIGTLENWRWFLTGIGTAILTMLGFLLKVLAG